MNNESKGDEVWSEWLDFGSPDFVNSIPDRSGVFKVHANMKILYIGGSINVKQSLLESKSNPCISQAKRFSYLITDNYEEVRDKLLESYRATHNGRSPLCIESQKT